MSVRPDRLIIPFASQDDWEAWLAEQHATSAGLWIKIAKKDSGIASVDYEQAVEGALCYVWIDGQKDKFDDKYWLQQFTPRRPKSKWSKINCGKVAELIEKGRMRPPGLRQVEEAKADGRWDAAYPGARTITVPDDLQRELDKNDVAREFFSTLDRTNRYAILYRLHNATKPEARARRIEKFVAMLSEHQKLVQT